MTHMPEEQAILKRYEQQVLPFWQENVTRGTLKIKENVHIAYAYVLPENAIGSIVISSGRIEALIKYKELLFDLYQAGYAVFILDHRGQGESSRMSANSHHGYVATFDDYVSDLKIFYQTVVIPHSKTTPHLLCHSMGSAIGALYLLRFPTDFQSAIFTAPMFGIRPPLPAWLTSVLVKTHLSFSRMISPLPRYFFGQGNYQELPFEQNALTHSRARYQIFKHEYSQHPEVQLGGVTSHWLRAAVDAMNTIERQAKHIQTPILHLQAGEDKVVENARQTRVCSAFPNCTSHILDGAAHEILMEQNSIRGKSLALILSFLANKAS